MLFGLMGDEWGDFIMKSFMIVTRYFSRDQRKKNEMNGACGTNRG